MQAPFYTVMEYITMNTTEVVQPNLFPFPFPVHLVFACIALFLFAYLFSKNKKPYQLIMAVAIPFSLTIWLSDSRTLFYAVGIVEFVLLIAAFISSIIYNKKHPELNEKVISEKSSAKEIADPDNNNSASSDNSEN
jgi:asparagine N-glycosylation enzyme membrane subunit Stt3